MTICEHLGVVTGLADLANFLVAAQHRISTSPDVQHQLTTILFGPSGSLPEALQGEFLSVTASAFPHVAAWVHDPRQADARQFSPGLVARAAGVSERCVYGNLIHKVLFQKFFASLSPDAFIFFDNGLSSYWQHDTDITATFAAIGLPFPALASLSLAPPLETPAYLRNIPVWRPQTDDYRQVFAALRAATGEHVPRSVSVIVLGSSYFRSNAIAWEEERQLYLRVIDDLRGHRQVLFKAHPRAAARPLVTAADGVQVLETTTPIEALIEPGHVGEVVGMASTALITLPKLLGWTAYRLDTPETRRAADQLPHQSLVQIVEKWPSP